MSVSQNIRPGRVTNIGQALKLLQGVLRTKAGEAGDTVVSETTAGQSPSAGVLGTYSREDHTHGTPAAGASYTDEEAQDAVGGILVDTTSVDLSYDDATPKITADVKFAGATPTDVASSATVGTGATPSHEDHAHKGVRSVNGQFGDVTIGGTGGTSPGRTNDPLTTHYTVEEFQGGDTVDGSIGETGWGYSGVAPTVVAGEDGHPGIYRQTSTGSNLLRSIRSWAAGTVGSIYSTNTFDALFTFRLTVTDGNTIAGAGYYTNSGNDPVTGIYFEKQAGDTNWFFVTRDGANETRTDSGVTVVANDWVTIRVRRINGSTVGGNIKINGGSWGTEMTHTTNIPSTSVYRAFKIKSASGTKDIDCDMSDQLITGLSR